jgi:hypothetical protein
MSGTNLDELLARLNSLHRELEAEIDKLLQEKREQFQYTLQKGKVRFANSVKSFQKSLKISSWEYLRSARPSHILSAPVIYSLIIPFALLDALVFVYQHICFRLYGIPLVRRSDYIVIDRHHLAYLNAIEKINCVYCGYGNGLLAYAREIAARTEQYWCPIKHASRSTDTHRLTQNFVEYGDAESYKKRLQELQDEISRIEQK